MTDMEKERKRFRRSMTVWTVLLFGAAAALLMAARRIPGFSDWYSETIYRGLVGTAGRVMGVFPFSMVEFGLYAGLIFLTVLFIRFRKTPGRLIRIYGLILALLLFSYSVGCGVNYYRRPFSSYLEPEKQGITAEDLRELSIWLTERVNDARKELNKEEAPYTDMRRKGKAAMEGLAEKYPCLSGYYPMPKPVWISGILSVQQYSGVYSPFTVEANYNRDMVPYNIPHTICHELSHLRGFMREDEANFIGYLACLNSEDADYRYSGYLLGWIYAGNALAKEDMQEYIRLYGLLDTKAKEDLKENSRFWAQFEGKAAETADRINDTYLKLNGQAEGTKTYGRVVDLMIRHFKKQP